MAKKKITDLIPDDKNFNKGSVVGTALLEKSIGKFGFREAATLDKNGKIVGGNKRTETAGALGFEDVEIIKADPSKIYALQYDDIDLDTPKGRELALALNQTAAKNIVIDAEVVEAELGEAVCEEWGIESSVKLEAEEDDFNGVPPKEPITVLGDLYELNEHRLHCADSCDSDAVAKLMNGKKADMVFTDPPYGIGLNKENQTIGKSDTYNAVLNDGDNTVAIDAFNLVSALNIKYLFFWGANHYSNALPSSTCWIVWDKQGGKHVTYADVELCYSNIEAPARLFTHIWDGFRRDSEKGEKRIHINQKPVKLISEIWQFFKIEFKIVLDLFVGSGSTLIAADQLKSICYGQELGEANCDLIVARYIKHRKETGGSLVIKRNGRQLSDKKKRAAA